MPGGLEGDNGEMDRIVLEDMVFSGHHGVRPTEREQAQDFKVDVEIDTDLVQSGHSDRVEDTVDYRRVYAIAKEVVEGESVKLIESLADRIAARVLDLDRVVAVSVRVAKRPQSMRPIEAAAVQIKRTRA